MARALAAELVKLRTTRMWWGLLLGAAALVTLGVGVTAAFAGRSAGPGAPATPTLDTAEGLRAALSAGFSGGYQLALVLGVIIGAVDYRHRTATQTFLASPHRSRVIAAKVLTAAAVGLLYGILTQLLSAVVGWLVAALRGAGPLPFGDASVLRSLTLGVPGVMLWCVVGVSLGILLRNQVAAVLVALGLVFVIDPLLGLALRQLDVGTAARYTPTSASSALVSGFTGQKLLPWWGGGLVLLGYGLVIAVLGWLVTARRDVT